jgi:hypothetical protein
MPETWIGIDPGYRGAVAALDDQGRLLALWDIPLVDPKARRRKNLRIDLDALNAIVASLRYYRDPLVRLEWPTTRPDEAAESSKNFGVGLGQIEALCRAHGLNLDKVAPNKWKGDLGLPGKKKDKKAGREACDAAMLWIPDQERSTFFGPRGGPRDGRAEAALIAWHGWSRTLSAMRVLRERYGKDAVEIQAFCLMAGSHRRGRKSLRLPM